MVAEEAAVVAAAAANSLPALGAGLGFREPLRAGVFLHQDRIGFLEVTADHFFRSPEKLDLLKRHFTLVPHGLDLSLGSADGLDARYLRRIAEIVRRTHAPWWSEHIAFTRAGKLRVGHLAPLPFTRDAVRVVAHNARRAQEAAAAPLILENITYQVVFPGAEFQEADFLAEILDRSGCGLLLDITNLHTNAVNHRFDPVAWLLRIPLERIVQLHFAGGHWNGAELIDSHSAPACEDVWRLMEWVLERAPVRGVILERDEKIPPIEELLPDLHRVNALGARFGRWN